jgi:Ca2+-binding RTX toxin-like protein
VSEILSADWAEYRQGDYILVNNVWGKGWRQNGQDFTQSITIDNTADLTSGVHMAWNWANVDAGNTSVLSYPEISVGYKPFGGEGTPSLNSRIQDIKTFDISHDLAIGGDTSRFDVAYDLWITDIPLGDQYHVDKEIMVWTHNGRPSQAPDPAHIKGTYTQQGITFDIVTYDNFTDYNGAFWDYIALMPRSDVLNATIDMRAVLTDLVELGLVSEKDFVTGYELGAEVTGGSGTLDINHVSHTLDVYGANAGANKLIGTVGHDRIYGLAGNDTIDAGDGDDLIVGGPGHDTLTGGNGHDIFYFNNISNKHDVISDFTSGEDTIAFDPAIFTSLSGDELATDAFKSGRKFDADTRLLYTVKTGTLYYDADGSGAGDTAHVVAVLENHTRLKLTDFDVF